MRGPLTCVFYGSFSPAPLSLVPKAILYRGSTELRRGANTTLQRPSLLGRAVALTLEKGEVRTKEFTHVRVPRYYLARMWDEACS